MAANSFGTIFKITTWGESHGKALGVVIDGCPAGLGISDEEINLELALRAPRKKWDILPHEKNRTSGKFYPVFLKVKPQAHLFAS